MSKVFSYKQHFNYENLSINNNEKFEIREVEEEKKQTPFVVYLILEEYVAFIHTYNIFFIFVTYI